MNWSIEVYLAIVLQIQMCNLEAFEKTNSLDAERMTQFD